MTTERSSDPQPWSGAARRAVLVCAVALALAACTDDTGLPTTITPSTTAPPPATTTLPARTTTTTAVPAPVVTPGSVLATRPQCDPALTHLRAFDETGPLSEPRPLDAAAIAFVSVDGTPVIVAERYVDGDVTTPFSLRPTFGPSVVVAEDASGATRWTYQGEEDRVMLEAVAGSTVIVGEWSAFLAGDLIQTVGDQVTGIDLMSGTARWSVPGRARAVTDDGMVVIDDGTVVDAATGEQVATLELGTDRWSVAGVVGPNLLVEGRNRLFVASTRTGSVAEVESAGFLDRAVGGDDATMVIVTSSLRDTRRGAYHAAAIDVATGEELWSHSIHRTAIEAGRAWMVGATVYLPDRPADFFAVDLATGERTEPTPLDELQPRHLLPVQGGAVAIGAKRRAIGIDLEGTVLWDTTLPYVTTVVASGDSVVVQAKARGNKWLVIVDAETGDVVTTEATDLAIDSLSIAGADLLAVGCR